MTVQTKTQLLARIPGAWTSGTVRGGQGQQFVETQLLIDVVDTFFELAQDAQWKASCDLATTGALAANTRTGDVLLANANGALGNIDGVLATVGMRILVKNEATGANNGIYVVDSVGGAGAKWQMTRADDLADGESAASVATLVEQGTVSADRAYMCSDDEGSAVVNTDALTFVAFGGAVVGDATPVDTAAAAVVGVALLASREDHVHAHGDIAAGGAHYHDTAQIENGSTIAGTTATEALDTLQRLHTLTQEPSGFPNITDSAISKVDGTRTFTIDDSGGGSFDIYIKGVLFSFAVQQDVVWTDVEGYHFFYFDNTGTLTHSVAVADWLAAVQGDGVPVAALYWDQANSAAIRFLDERHGMSMDGATHEYLHRTLGAQWVSGGALGSFTIGDGSADAHAKCDCTTVVIADEDLFWTFADGSPQDLTPILQAPVYYRSGVAGDWRKATADDYPFVYDGKGGYVAAASRIPINEDPGAGWGWTEVTANGRFVLTHIFATNDVAEPVIAVHGQVEYSTLGDAQTGAKNEIAALAGVIDLLAQEATPLGSIILQTSGVYANAVNARVVQTAEGGDYVDHRLSKLDSVTGVASNHGSLSGLAADDHIQYALADGSRAVSTPANADVVTAAGEALPFVIRKAFAAGGGGAPDDVEIYNAAAPFDFRIIDATTWIATAVGGSTVELRSASGGGGSALSMAFSGAATAVVREDGSGTTYATSQVSSGGSLYLRRSDSGVAGEIVILAIKE
jgi:hypothetical protein